MQYAILVYESEADRQLRADPQTRADYMAPYTAYVAALRQAGVLRGGEALHDPGLATTVRRSGGKRLVQDGPVAATHEQLGGFFVIEVADLDAALAWAERCPAAETGAVEVRPVVLGPP